MDASDYDYAAHEMLQELVDSGCIEEGTKEHGIALFCIDNGYDAMSDKQRWVYDHSIVPHLKTLQTRREVAERMRGMLG